MNAIFQCQNPDCLARFRVEAEPFMLSSVDANRLFGEADFCPWCGESAIKELSEEPIEKEKP